MRIDPTPSTLVGTTIPTITSRVDPDGARRMMEMLVNLYSDRRLAVAREYVSNAVDATRAAGSTDPVAITTPTPNEPNLIVTDRGTGMSMAEVEETYLAFAASTKRNTNDMVGGLGVGAKSAWALTESFLIDTVKDGRHTTVRAARNLEHQVLMCDAPSQEANGTTIIIPVEAREQWQRAVQEVARAHDAGAVRVDGAPVESIASGPRIGPVLCCQARPQNWSEKILIRSGGTLFSSVPEVNQLVSRSARLTACVVELPIGSFDHTPSRESVIATERTLTAVKTALEQYRRAYDVLQQRITTLAATDMAAAVTLRADTLGKVGGYGMLPIPYQIGVPAGAGWLHSSKGSHRRSWKNDVEDTFDATATPGELTRTMVVTNVPSGKGLSQFATFLKNNHPEVRRLIAIPQGHTSLALNVRNGMTTTGQVWPISAKTSGIAGHYTYEQWSTALAATRQQNPRRSPQCNDYRCVINGGGPIYESTLTGRDIAALGLPVIYIEGEAYSHKWRHVLRVGSIESVTVYLDKRKSGPLIAAIPGAMTPDEWRQRRLAAAMKMSDTALLALVYRSSWCDSYWAAFDVAYLAVIKMLTDDTTHPTHDLLARIAILVSDSRGIAKLLDEDLIHSLSTQHETIKKMYEDLVNAYPLLGGDIQDKNKKHHIDYVVHTPPAGG